MSDKSLGQKDGLLELLKKLWLPVARCLGAITLAYNFYQLWLGDRATVTWFLAVGELVVLTFRSELVERDPEDESATMLVERVNAGREKRK